MSEAIPAFLTLIIMPFTFSITNGIIFGLISSFFIQIITGKALRLMPGTRGPTEAVTEMTPLSGYRGDDENYMPFKCKIAKFNLYRNCMKIKIRYSKAKA